MKIGVACGGTGGHILPGLTVARALRDRQHDITVWLSGKSVESRAAAGWDGPTEAVRAVGFPSGASPRALAVPFVLLGAILECRSRLRAARPDVLLGMGSYASVGPVVGARMAGIPVALHESNVVPGRAVSFLARFASAVAVSFDETRRYLQHPRIVVTGAPVRPDLDTRFEPGLLKEDRFTLLVMGGSQGADRLDHVVSTVVCDLVTAGRALQVIHLCRPENVDLLTGRYRETGVPHLVYGFLKEIGSAYHAADLAVTRAGSGTCGELAACRTPALVLPFPSARRDHQRLNALAHAADGGADVMEESDLAEDRLRAYLERCLDDPSKLAGMREVLSRRPSGDAATAIAQLLEELVDAKQDKA